MEISIVDAGVIKVKGKQSSIAVNPGSQRAKIQADASIYLSKDTKTDVAKVEGNRLVIQGAGDYEIGGIKITANRFGKHIAYDIRIDAVEVFVGNAEVLAKVETLQKSQEILKEYHVVVLQCDTWPQETIVPSLSASVVVLFGEKAAEGAKSLGSESINKSSKYQTTLDKLPEEQEVVILE